MKNTIKIGLVALASMSLCSCADWFDVNPKTDLKAEEFYKTPEGFESALAGNYTLLTRSQSYGGNWTFRTMEYLVGSYDRLPDGAGRASDVYIYDRYTTGFNTKSQLEEMWLSSYETIANANNLLRWLDLRGEAVVTEENTRKYLRGEALALRAFLHFDLLRAWGPIYRDAPETLSIPYRKVADQQRLPLLPARTVVENVLADLTEAKQLLAYQKTQSVGIYDNFRFTYHAVNALLARVYCYAGDAEKAIACAKEVIAESGRSLQVSNNGDPALYQEVLVGLYKDKMQTDYSQIFSEGPQFVNHLYCELKTMNEFYGIVGSETEDIRAKSTAFARYNDQNKAITLKYVRNPNMVIPLIRLPEMYYILCEMSPLEEAAAHLNKVRNRRGYSSFSNVTFRTEEDRIRELDKEFRKEFYAEGQYFYFVKRHKLSTFTHCPVSEMTEKQYVFPLTDREKEYGWHEPEAGESTSENKNA